MVLGGVPLLSLVPRPPKTNASHPKCYLKGSKDCGGNITREHYLSETLLKELGTGTVVLVDRAGRGSVPREIGISNLQSKILCKRHHECLSTLDETAGELFRKFRAIDQDLRRFSDPGYFRSEIDAERFERWVLKLVCGSFYSTSATKDGVPLLRDHSVDEALLHQALLLGAWNRGCGLYLGSETESGFKSTGKIGVGVLTSSMEKKFVGGRLIMMGLSFDVLFDNSAFYEEWYNAGWFHRPAAFVFEKGRRSHGIAVPWPNSIGGRIMTVKYPESSPSN